MRANFVAHCDDIVGEFDPDPRIDPRRLSMTIQERTFYPFGVLCPEMPAIARLTGESSEEEVASAYFGTQVSYLVLLEERPRGVAVVHYDIADGVLDKLARSIAALTFTSGG